MYLHVGNNENIRLKDVIGIFDADSATVSSITKKYLSDAEVAKAIHFSSIELPKSFILYRKNGEFKICFSPLSSVALLGRTTKGTF